MGVPSRAVWEMLAACALFAACAPAADRWSLNHFYDKDDSSFIIQELAFSSPMRGLAAGMVQEKGKLRAAALRTGDGGKTWSMERLSEAPVSLFFLNEREGWMASDRGVWATRDGGQNWHKIARQKGILHVYFLDSLRGWAAGVEKRVLASRDGGKTWTPLAAAQEPQSDAKRSAYGWIDFAGGRFGMIVGWHEPERPDEPRLPAWMEPQKTRRRQEWPSLTLLLQTVDGGQTWKASTASLFGRITRVRLSPGGGSGLVLVRFRHAMDYPSEVYRIDLAQNRTTRIFREKDHVVTDIALPGGRTAYLAAIEPSGSLPDSPVPGKLKILRSRDLVKWEVVPVDYRATARHAVMTFLPDGQGWAATDTGMILRLERQ